MLLFINTFSLTFCALIIARKILNIGYTKQILCTNVLFSGLITSFIIIVPQQFYPFSTLVALTVIIIFCYKTYHTPIETTLTTLIISFCLSHVVFLISGTLVCAILACKFTMTSYIQHRITIQLLVCCFHIFISFLIFRIKRLQKGIPFVYNNAISIIPILFSLLLLLLILSMEHFLPLNKFFNIIYFIALILVISISIIIDKSITRTYNDKRRDRDLDILNEHLDDLEADYQKMTEDKDELARIVHRDNKLVPAMLLSVETFLTEFPDATPQMKKRGDELMAELREAAEGRKGIILQQDKKCTAKPIETGISALDEVLKYMQKKAMDKNITLSASADLGIEDLVSKTIDETDLKTLTNDLLENAIIASSYNNGTNVYFIIGYFDKRLAIHVYDSGIPFTKEVLVDLGVTKHTTHEEDGGSGIGSMEIFKIARKYRASYIIDEYDTYAGPYTKRISIIFDKRNKYKLNTSRPQEEINYLRQRTDLNIEARKNRL